MFFIIEVDPKLYLLFQNQLYQDYFYTYIFTTAFITIWKKSCLTHETNSLCIFNTLSIFSFNATTVAQLPKIATGENVTGPWRPLKGDVNVTVCATSWRTLISEWLLVPSIDQNLQPFTVNGDVSILLINSKEGCKTTNKQKQTLYGFFLFNLTGTSPGVYPGEVYDWQQEEFHHSQSVSSDCGIQQPGSSILGAFL